MNSHGKNPRRKLFILFYFLYSCSIQYLSKRTKKKKKQQKCFEKKCFGNFFCSIRANFIDSKVTDFQTEIQGQGFNHIRQRHSVTAKPQGMKLYFSGSQRAAIAGLFVVLLPVFLPNLFGPLGRASPSMFSVRHSDYRELLVFFFYPIVREKLLENVIQWLRKWSELFC